MEDTLNYHETLELVENFIIKSGIRHFCKTWCKGSCCQGTVCAIQCSHSHLLCSGFICITLHEIIANVTNTPYNYSNPSWYTRLITLGHNQKSDRLGYYGQHSTQKAIDNFTVNKKKFLEGYPSKEEMTNIDKTLRSIVILNNYRVRIDKVRKNNINKK